MSTTTRWQQALLPGEGRRSARDWVVDVVAYLIALAIGAVVLAQSAHAHSEGTGVLDFFLGVAALVALGWRRKHPDGVGVLVTAAAIVSAFSAGPAVIAGFNVALRGSRRGIVVVIALNVVSAVVFPLLYPPGDGYVLNLIVGLLVIAVVIGWGLLVRVQREQLAGLRERARQDERRRIAAEMHDVLAHRVSLLSVQAGALEFNPGAPPEDVAAATGVIRATARSALEELRQVIGVLREDTDGAPQPTLAEIPALVEESRAAGMRVNFESEVADEASAALGRTAYRVVQEGLTNARKHAPGAAVDVEVRGGEQLVVAVVTRPLVAVSADPLPGAGTGLIGLGERVTLAGGALEHGSDGAGGFVLRASLPWQ
jgi:signal transduction histidine kinase